MELLSAVFLGVVQGLTEFLPISSSAHLIVVPWLLGWKPEGLVFDVALHVGTALAVLSYFWRDWVMLAVEAVRGIIEMKPLGNSRRRLAWFLVVGTMPAAVAGLTMEDYVEDYLRSPLVTVVTLTVFALVLMFAERWSSLKRTLEEFNWGDSIWIGLSQAVALIPGVSRSGITISAALLRDADRPTAARFSFLLSTPVIAGAGILEGLRFVRAMQQPAAVDLSWAVLAAGITSAAVTGFLCIAYFLRYLRTHSFMPFVVYRFGLAALILIFYLKYDS